MTPCLAHLSDGNAIAALRNNAVIAANADMGARERETLVKIGQPIP